MKVASKDAVRLIGLANVGMIQELEFEQPEIEPEFRFGTWELDLEVQNLETGEMDTFARPSRRHKAKRPIRTIYRTEAGYTVREEMNGAATCWMKGRDFWGFRVRKLDPDINERWTTLWEVFPEPEDCIAACIVALGQHEKPVELLPFYDDSYEYSIGGAA